jgi:formate hydrogenlyase subunit 3/multisubunit Na+/H+ antiporter MnhD subunit
VFRHSHNNEHRGIGLYTEEQGKNTTPFQYFAQIVVGAVFFCVGVLLLVGIFDARSRETLKFGSPDPHLGAFLFAAVLIIIGMFMAHAGVIFWGRRILARLRSDQNRHVA